MKSQLVLVVSDAGFIPAYLMDLSTCAPAAAEAIAVVSTA